jgi:beta-lactamase regulating signal transducer with metallopeptidase domain
MMSTSSPSALPIFLVLVKATCLLLAALGASLAMSRASAGARHLVWLVVLGALLVLPALAVWSPLPVRVLPEELAPAAALTPAAPVSTREIARSLPERATAAREVATPGGASSMSPPGGVDGQSPGFGTVLLLVWALGAVSLTLRLAYGVYSVRRIVRRAEPLERPDWQTPLYQIADRLGLDTAPRLVRSDDVKMPFAAGVVASTIVLPAESDGWSAERRSAVLVHELGHIRRRDLVGHTIGRIACALYWFHPLVWTAARRLRAESERACDDLALSFGTPPSDYAEHLLDIVTAVRDHYTPSVALAMAHRKEFEGRMLAILDPELRRRGPGRAQTVSIVGALAVLVSLIGAATPVPRAGQGRELSRRPQVVKSAGVADTAAHTATSVPRVGGIPGARPTVQAEPTPAPAAGPTRGRPSAATSSRVQPNDERAALLAKTLRTDASASVRRVAAWGLQQYAETDVALEALAAAAGSDADASVREMAAWALAEARPTPAVTTALAKAVRQDRDPKVRATGVWAMGSIGDDSAVETLIGVLASPDPALRELAAWSIGSCEPSRAPAALVSALSDRDRDVRESVAWALYTIEDPATTGAIDAALRREPDTEVQRGLIRALGATGEGSVDALQRLVASPDSEIRGIAVAALAGGDASGPWPWPRPEPRPFP